MKGSVDLGFYNGAKGKIPIVSVAVAWTIRRKLRPSDGWLARICTRCTRGARCARNA